MLLWSPSLRRSSVGSGSREKNYLPCREKARASVPKSPLTTTAERTWPSRGRIGWGQMQTVRLISLMRYAVVILPRYTA